jgi:hypothetical protein
MMVRGILRAFNGTTYLAAVEFVGSFAFTVGSVPVSKGIAAAQLVPGRTVWVAVEDRTDPGSMMVLGVR